MKGGRKMKKRVRKKKMKELVDLSLRDLGTVAKRAVNRLATKIAKNTKEG